MLTISGGAGRSEVVVGFVREEILFEDVLTISGGAGRSEEVDEVEEEGGLDEGEEEGGRLITIGESGEGGEEKRGPDTSSISAAGGDVCCFVRFGRGVRPGVGVHSALPRDTSGVFGAKGG